MNVAGPGILPELALGDRGITVAVIVIVIEEIVGVAQDLAVPGEFFN